jgi:hypothetical protein
MTRAACRKLTNSQASGSPSKSQTFDCRRFDRSFSWMRALFSLQCQSVRHSETTARDDDDARNTRLSREDTLRDAATSLSLGERVSFASREYQLIEQLWRTDP